MSGSVRIHFARFVEASRRRAPLYSRLSAGLVEWPALDGLFADTPEPARVPTNLFAAVHYLLLGEPDAELRRWYPNLSGSRPTAEGDPLPAFLAFCDDHADQVKRLLATRVPQTNEIGRSSLLVAGFNRLPPGPKAQLDVGASAGLNLMSDRLGYDDGHGVLGESDLVLECSVRPAGRRLATELPQLASRLGLDANPLDLTDPEAARWLEACVWPDQADRFDRLAHAVRLFQRAPVDVRQGDAVDDLAGTLAELGVGMPVVTTSWALCYLTEQRQREFVAELERLGTASDLAWLWVESPIQVSVLPVPSDLVGSDATVLGYSTWRDGRRSDRTLARCHPHGYWLTWL